MTRKCRLRTCRKPLPAMKDCATAYQETGFCDPDCSRVWNAEKRREYAERKRAREAAKPRTARVTARPKKKVKSLAKLANEAAELLQRLVRLKAADANGYASCCTCGKVVHFSEADGGHYIERGKLSTKLLEENIHFQCRGCNAFRMKLASTVLAFRRHMVDTYGEKFVRELEDMARQPKKYTRAELEEMKSDFRSRIQEQERRLGV